MEAFKLANQIRSAQPSSSASDCLRVGQALAAVLEEFGEEPTRTVTFSKLYKGGLVEFSVLVNRDERQVEALNERLEEMTCDQPDLDDAMGGLTDPDNDGGLQCYFSPEGDWPERLYGNPDYMQELRDPEPVDFEALHARQKELQARRMRARGLPAE